MKKIILHEIMSNAWRMFKVTGESFAECLKRAWAIYKLSKEMKSRTVQFLYKKVSGEIRQAFGTMKDDVIASQIKGTDTRKKNDDLFTYYDTEKSSFRSFKKFNLINVVL